MAAQTAAEIAASISTAIQTRMSSVNTGLRDNVPAIATSIGDAVAAAITAEDTDDDGAIATAVAAVALAKKTVTVTSATLVALGAVTTGTVNVGTALPASARVYGANVTVATKFQDVGDSDTTVVDVGISGTAELHIKDASLKTTGQKGPNGATSWPGRGAGAEQVIATFGSDVNFDTLTAGSCTIDVFYFVLA